MRDLGEAFRAVMKQTGWNAARLARELGVSQPWVSMVLSGQRDPGVRRAAALLERAGWELQLVPSGDNDPVKRRDFLAGLAASAVLTPAAGPDPYASAAYVDGVAARLAVHEAQLGGAPLAREATRHAARAIPAARAGSPALAVAASRLCQQTALILHDVRQLGRAGDTATAALDLGRSGADIRAQARALDTLSMITAHLSDGRGAAYARQGLALPGLDDASRAMLAARLGRALALAGQGRKARDAFGTALELADGTGLAADLFGNTGIGLTDLGLTGPAEDYLDTAARLTAGQPFLHALYVARQAKAALRARQPDLTAGRMTTLAALAPLVSSPRLAIHLRHLYDGTRIWDAIPAVRDARAGLRAALS
jgi:transcriptional regulator with XRE-family HTH domain